MGEEDKTKRHFDSTHLEIREEKRELSEMVDLFVSSLLKLAAEEFKAEKSRFVVNLLVVCLKKWAAFNEQEQWSLAASKWTSTAAKSEETADSGAERLVLEYFMGSFEQLFDSSFENQLDEGLISKLLEISEVSGQKGPIKRAFLQVLITKSTVDLEKEFADRRQLDVRKQNDDLVETRSKTLHLALSFCGLVLFQGEPSAKVSSFD